MSNKMIDNNLEYLMKDYEKHLLLGVSKHSYHEHPKVSVIVPVYKVDKYLTKCLNSIVNQTLEEIEIIIVDEGDQDRCRTIIDFFEQNDPRIVAPHQKNGGYGASCNLGFSLARGEYIAIVESDDYIEPEMYEEMYEYAKLLNADVVKTPYYEYFTDGRKQDCCYRGYVTEACPEKTCFSVKEYGALLEVHASLWSGLYKTSYMREHNIQFITAKGGAYVDVGFRIDTLVNTNRCAWLNKPYYNYRIDSEGSTTNNFKIGPMLQRWKEVHEKFKPIQNEYDNYYGPHLIIDEYYNTVGWLSLIEITDQDLKVLQENMKYISDELIEQSTALNDRQKYELKLFKHNIKGFKRFAWIKRFKNRNALSIIHTFDKISDPMLLQFLLTLFITCFLGEAAIKFNMWNIGSGILHPVFMVLQALALLGIGICFVGKLVRKVLRLFI